MGSRSNLLNLVIAMKKPLNNRNLYSSRLIARTADICRKVAKKPGRLASYRLLLANDRFTVIFPTIRLWVDETRR